MELDRFPLIANITDPRQLRDRDLSQLDALADEVRRFLMETIGRTGGHLGAALGVVELTLALFHEFEFLQDRICWDVGHQAHVHKLLTGRGGRFGEYGEWGGVSKFLERRESLYDHLGAGHASTSVSAALGLAIARDRRGEDHEVIAVLGDGALTGGLAYEALSLAGSMDLNLIVVLNDNGMSIDQNVGAFTRSVTRTVTRITASDVYSRLREDLKKLSTHVPFGDEIVHSLKHLERSLKDYFSPDVAAFFESLGFHYFGPVPGHNLKDLVSMLGHAKSMQGPILVHVRTIKGKGMGSEVENTFAAHAVSPKTAAARNKPKNTPERKSWTQIYSEGLAEIVAADPDVIAITAAMRSNTGLAPIAKSHPEQVLDVGIAEANGYCAAVGMAIGGLKPFVTIYSTFSQRAFDQMIHDIALQSLPVRIMLDRGGFVGADGPTHHGVFDMSYLRLIPGFVHMAPSNELELRRMLRTAYEYEAGPIAMRYPRGDTPIMSWEGNPEPISIGTGELIRDAKAPIAVLVAIGSMVSVARNVAELLEQEGLTCTVVNARFVKPLDAELIAEQIERTGVVVTLEENVLCGGFGEGVLRLMAERGLHRPAKTLGIPDRFISYGSQADQYREAGLLPDQIAESVRELVHDIDTRTSRRKLPA